MERMWRVDGMEWVHWKEKIKGETWMKDRREGREGREGGKERRKSKR